MSENVFLLGAIAIPIVLFTLLRINAALVFLSLCLGAVLVQYVGGEANSLVSLFFEDVGSVSASTLQLVLVLAPAIVTCVVTVFSIRGKVKTLLNLITAAGASALAFLLVVPLLPHGVRVEVQSQDIWQFVTQAQAFLVGVGALVSLAFLWTQRRNLRHNKH